MIPHAAAIVIFYKRVEPCFLRDGLRSQALPGSSRPVSGITNVARDSASKAGVVAERAAQDERDSVSDTFVEDSAPSSAPSVASDPQRSNPKPIAEETSFDSFVEDDDGSSVKGHNRGCMPRDPSVFRDRRPREPSEGAHAT